MDPGFFLFSLVVVTCFNHKFLVFRQQTHTKKKETEKSMFYQHNPDLSNRWAIINDSNSYIGWCVHYSLWLEVEIFCRPSVAWTTNGMHRFWIRFFRPCLWMWCRQTTITTTTTMMQWEREEGKGREKEWDRRGSFQSLWSAFFEKYIHTPATYVHH